MSIHFEKKVSIPAQMKRRLPLSEKGAATVAARAAELQAVFTGKSDRFLLIVGPCSADCEAGVSAYLERLRRLADLLGDRIVIVPRIYTNKPRSAAGYKGMLHYPQPDAQPDLLRGIAASRALHLRAIEEYGFSAADELLYPENYRYFDDLLAYAAIGARSAENQQHRLVASGLNIPVGIKNTTGGQDGAQLNAVLTAQQPHTFLYRGWQVHTDGNPLAHTVLRGFSDRSGQPIANYEKPYLLQFAKKYRDAGAENPAVIIDTNHANSGKNALLQREIALNVLQSRTDSALRPLIKGLMIESYLQDGAQAVGGGCFGQSITDPCLGWEKTERLILEIAERL